jgi:hypothetical protein
MVLLSMPASRSLKLKVPNTNSNGSPAAKPKNSIRKLAGCAYMRQDASQEKEAVSELGFSFMSTLSKSAKVFQSQAP